MSVTPDSRVDGSRWRRGAAGLFVIFRGAIMGRDKSGRIDGARAFDSASYAARPLFTHAAPLTAARSLECALRIMDSAEAAALSGGAGGDGAPGSYYDARWLNVHTYDGKLASRARKLMLTPSRHFDHLAVNTSYSAVLVPLNVNVDGEYAYIHILS
ncbi:hypothetical protein EVAR_79679_1 [Eumeta japonica]|uniref:Uncharacterized protein n=1 Tax=Eumeta variegata TaxID=151549 RepID=A0A4C1TC30_EUMVA|nr:hypothetical protein EVAR_79679_1 [Eumeta japonica]